jgi:DNA processing protein
VTPRPVRVLLPLDPAWPDSLCNVLPPVSTLHAVGDLAMLAPPLIAVVGTRQATDYGIRITTQLVEALASAGVGIVSGLARGIDAAAHRAALNVGGRTIAVLGTGVDVPYPAAHRSLHERIAEQGLVLSEVPPGTRALPGCFPRRNRIIAGLAPVTLVVEAGLRSGAQSTANAALALGRLVAAVPGPIDAPQSAGTNQLLLEGGHVITCAGDVFGLLGLAPPRAERVAVSLRGDERVVYDALEAGATLLEDLADVVALPLARVLSAVTALELAGHVGVGLDDRVRRTLPLTR